MKPGSRAVELARQARQTGLFCVLGGSDAGGLASLGAILAEGPDAAAFLHNQLTNDVKALEPGQGNLSARVRRTGHLLHLLSVHRLPSRRDAFLLLLERDAVVDLLGKLDEFLFADQLTLTDVSEEFVWMMLQGPSVNRAAERVVAGGPGIAWEELSPCAVCDLGAGMPDGSLVLSRSLTGDVGLLVALARQGFTPEAEDCWAAAAREEGLVELRGAEREEVLEILRIEAGVVRVGPDTAGKDRLLPETCLEQQVVSYTKGCYLGQEVIARVRTYGTLPSGLRGLVLGAADGSTDPLDLLERLPLLGENLVLAEDGKIIGQVMSRTISPVLDRAVAMAYLDRDHRTPGAEWTVRGRNGNIPVRVMLLPFHHAADREARVALLHDRAIRTFAEGKEEAALSLLEEALRLNPSFEDGYEAVGVILGRSQRFHEAIDFFRRLEEVAPHEPIVNTNLSLFYMKLGDKAAAEDEAGKAMQKSFFRSTNAGKTGAAAQERMEKSQQEDALRKKEMFSQVLEIDPEDDVALFGLGNALSTLGQWEEAAELLGRASEVGKDNSAVYLAWGKALEKLDRLDQAGEVYRRGKEVASRKGDLMPLREMDLRLLMLRGSGSSP